MTKSRYRLDLHTHTHFSGDSTTTIDEYVAAFMASGLDAVAVTDHLVIDGALKLRKILGERVIVGQEFRVKEGELIGLFLEERIPPALDARAASERIRSQGGLVYVPHPGDSKRTSVSIDTLVRLAGDGLIDVIEVANSKIFDPSLIEAAREVALRFGTGVGAGSDSHVALSLGSSSVDVGEYLSAKALLGSLKADPEINWTHFDPVRRFSKRIVPSTTDLPSAH